MSSPACDDAGAAPVLDAGTNYIANSTTIVFVAFSTSVLLYCKGVQLFTICSLPSSIACWCQLASFQGQIVHYRAIVLD